MCVQNGPGIDNRDLVYLNMLNMLTICDLNIIEILNSIDSLGDPVCGQRALALDEDVAAEGAAVARQPRHGLGHQLRGLPREIQTIN